MTEKISDDDIQIDLLTCLAFEAFDGERTEFLEALCSKTRSESYRTVLSNLFFSYEKINTAARQVSLNKQKHKFMAELVIGKSVESENWDDVVESIEYKIFQLDRKLGRKPEKIFDSDNNELNKNKTLADYGITEGSTLICHGPDVQ